MEEECKGGEIQPMSQDRLHGEGKLGKAFVNGSPASGDINSLAASWVVLRRHLR